MSSKHQHLPLIAILRGITPDYAVPIAQQIVANGITQIEVPLNSPNALQSITNMVESLPEHIIVGAGTVLHPDQVRALSDIGAKLIVSPNLNPEVIALTRKLGMISAPGVATPSEAFVALDAGASLLKVFPAEQISPKALKAWCAVLPAKTQIVPVGGIDENTMAQYYEAGATGFGLGGSLYSVGQSVTVTARRAVALVAACRQTMEIA